LLADGDSGKFMNAVALRTTPPRSSKTRPAKPAPEAAPAQPETAAEDTRSPMQKLMDRFR
jgi:PTH1 family peptidyl-tRNA hydrolase